MVKTGVQSGHIYDDSNIEEGFRMIKEAGFDCIDFNIDTKLSYREVCEGKKCDFFNKSDEELKEYYKPHKQAIEKYGITYSQMHAPFPVYAFENEFANGELLNSMIKCIMLCEYLGCPYLVVHPIKVSEDETYEVEKKINFDFYKQLIPYADKYNVKICLENMFFGKGGLVTEAVCSDPQEAVEYIDKLNETAGKELFAFCYDLGHATLLGKNVRRSINTLGHRLQVLHIHDNDGVKDIHMQPYAYRRGGGGSAYVTDWEGFIQGLRDIDYKGVLSFETFNSIKVLPQELKPAMLNYIAAVGKYFAKRLEK